MAGHKRHKRGGHHEEEHDNEERWLVSFADMMTLMFALFMVLFSISSVNTSKFESLKKSLEESFNAKLLSGGQKIMETGDTEQTERSSADPPLPSLLPAQAVSQSFSDAKAKDAAAAAAAEDEAFAALKRRIDAEAKKLGLSDKVRTQVRTRGLVIRLLTDGVLFDSGDAEL